MNPNQLRHFGIEVEDNPYSQHDMHSNSLSPNARKPHILGNAFISHFDIHIVIYCSLKNFSICEYGRFHTYRKYGHLGKGVRKKVTPCVLREIRKLWIQVHLGDSCNIMCGKK